MALADLRKDYRLAHLNETEVLPDPIAQFGAWFDQALQSGTPEANAMTLATVDAQGRPSARIVLIKEFDQRGFSWFTHYTSRKGDELAANPHAALLFFWSNLERQVRIEGTVEQLSAVENDRYFHSRPLGSRQSARASEQSQPIADRAALEQRLQAVVAEFPDNPPRPSTWGGYRLVPNYLEFWQGGSARLHDRVAYRRQTDGSWQITRLQP